MIPVIRQRNAITSTDFTVVNYIDTVLDTATSPSFNSCALLRQLHSAPGLLIQRLQRLQRQQRQQRQQEQGKRYRQKPCIK